MAYDLDTLIVMQLEQCNKIVNGECASLRCIRRGGGVKGINSDWNLATCEHLEMVEALTDLKHLTE